MIPAKASARGIPTARPTMRPTFVRDPPLLDCDESAVAEGVMMTVITAVDMPPAPEVTLVWIEVMGVTEVVDDAVLDVDEDERLDVDELTDAVALPVATAMPVNVERVGAVEAVLSPIVAYAFPLGKSKNGRTCGTPSQHFTMLLSPLQHHWSLWSSHCFKFSAPVAAISGFVSKWLGQNRTMSTYCMCIGWKDSQASPSSGRCRYISQ